MNRKRILIVCAALLSVGLSMAQAPAPPDLYHPGEDAGARIKADIAKARESGKHVLLQIGGNWCSWCLRFEHFVHEDPQLDSALKADYVVYHLNYSSQNKNPEIMARLGYPQRFGFPVFVILDANGKRLHTQNSAYLEEGKGYNKAKVLEFLDNWSPRALDPAQYN